MDSVVGEAGRIMTKQLVRMVVMMTSEKRPWVKMAMATRRMGLKGLRRYTASVALNRKMSFFLLIITNVYREGPESTLQSTKLRYDSATVSTPKAVGAGTATT